ncbi:MAG: hypothetical protein HYS75_03200 [Nitrosopumilales archaeon]|nr:hypothetical protein [Nitrosopumilales archaeon]
MSENEVSRSNILSTVDYVIERIQELRKIMIGVSISALILAPLAIGLSVYLSTHPLFFKILEQKDEFGLFLSILLGSIIVISGIWLYTGIRQYRSLSPWKKRYDEYLKKKNELDSSLTSQYKLDEN